MPRKILKRRKQLEKDLDHITQEMYKRNMELIETNKTLSLLRTIDSLVLESQTSIKIACEQITRAITEATNHAFVGLLTRTSYRRELVTLNGWSANDATKGDIETYPLFNQSLGLSLTNEWVMGPETNRQFELDLLDIREAAALLNTDEKTIKQVIKKLAIGSCYIVKLQTRQRIVGLLVIGFYKPMEQIPESDIMLIKRISDSIGVALDNKLLFEENQYVLRKLKDSNDKLKALDEAKDDFISMASHQLRTPLTSIKGYVSMVMEGDVGKINKQQEEMLGQAFFSSQRMVYLIADLLNLSRIKTGKFIIEAHPVNLAEVISSEMRQLKDTAASRGHTLDYEAPKNFPDLMFDETKIRQVIMNFTDNAIYYTPNGGHIVVKLIETPTTIEMRVEDNGIGVPKAERAHLFTKFYRAGNARKARPDGTGLGLFMARKVIMAQGGSLLFESAENKGSTFGFIFSKAKIAVPNEQPTQAQVPVIKLKKK